MRAALLVLLWLALPAARAAVAEPDPAQLEFFETKIRPLLADQCYQCHSQDADKVKGGLLLDTKEGVLKGGDTGPAIVPGQPDKSLLIKAVRYTDPDLEMPPKGRKLAPEQIADLEAWVKMGAPDTRLAKPVAILKTDADREKARNHWAYQPVRQAPVPRPKSLQGWVRTPIDAFVLAKLEEKKMEPSRPADPRTLLRRAHYDLTGLPPTAEDVAAFAKDNSPGAFARVVDRLLASPRYGERWGRHWLDVARYANTRGDVGNNERRYPFSYTYRDYVIQAFNDDLPFDQFVLEQIAADQVSSGSRGARLAALGFLTLGPRFNNNVNDIIDDRIDVVTRGLMGVSVTCARCHDHKFDPIPTKDYYSLHGVFASCTEPAEGPLLTEPPTTAAYQDYVQQRTALERDAREFRKKLEGDVRERFRQSVGDYLWVGFQAQRMPAGAERAALIREKRLSSELLQRWKVALDRWERKKHPVWTPWFAFAALPEEAFEAKARELAGKITANDDPARPVHPLVAQAFRVPPASMQQVADRYGNLFKDVDKKWQALLDAHEKKAKATRPPAPVALRDADEEALRQILYAADAPPNLASGQVDRFLDNDSRNRERALQRRIVDLDITHAGSPARATTLADLPKPRNSRVFVRGNSSTPGAEVPRQFLEVVEGKDRKPFAKGSGRLELAQAIASRDNPLTARVLVNRVWTHHFGEGLVRTPSDFGLRSEPPTHPELLDHLAAWFVSNGWSVKKLHRLILLSSAYQQASEDKPRYLKLDPANQWLWKMNRQRLDFEALRDSLLAVGGSLETTMGGQPVDLATEPYPARRTVYGYIDRLNLAGLFRTFDFANPDASNPQRFTTTVPQQALFMMNSPLVVEQARNLVERQAFQALPTDEERMRLLYQYVYQRDPQPLEVKLAKHFLAKSNGEAGPAAQPEKAPARASVDSVWQYGYGSFDPVKRRTKQFTPLAKFTGSAWQTGEKLPDPQMGWLHLNPGGGFPGKSPAQAVIRRWVAPQDSSVSIEGTLGHATSQGDGVAARVVSSRTGELGSWVAHKATAPTKIARVEVKRGDTLDFMVDCRANPQFDTFTWAPILRLLDAPPELMAMAGEPQPGMMAPRAASAMWSAQADFRAPPKATRAATLSAWEEYAQVLLLANEFAFVN